MCALLVLLGPFGRSGVNPGGLLHNAIWEMDVTYCPGFGNLTYVHVVVDTCSAFVNAVARAGEKASRAIKAIKSAMLVMAVPWALKTAVDLLTHFSSSVLSYPHG